MTSDSYVMLFDVIDDGYQAFWFVGIGLIGIAVGVLLLKSRTLQALTSYRGPRWSARGLPWFMLCWGIFWTVGSFIGLYGEYRTLTAAERTGAYKQADGIVEYYVSSQSNRGNVTESFSVGETRFEYSGGDVVPYFSKPFAKGGPIHAGAHVKIRYVEGKIIRLDMLSVDVPSQAEAQVRAETTQRQIKARYRENPLFPRLTVAFSVAGLAGAIWCILDWRRWMRYAVPPELRSNRRFQIGSRLFLVAGTLFGAFRCFQTMSEEHWTADDFIDAAPYTAGLLALLVIVNIYLRFVDRPAENKTQGRV